MVYAALGPVADAALDRNDPERNYGADAWLPLGGAGAQSPALRFSLPRWPLSAAVERATLWVRVRGDEASLWHVRAVAWQAPWSEAELNWNSAAAASLTLGAWQGPTDPAAPSAPSVAVSGGEHWWRWDITEVVRGWASGELANEGLMLLGEDEGPGASAYIAARESEQPAVLEVRFTTP